MKQFLPIRLLLPACFLLAISASAPAAVTLTGTATFDPVTTRFTYDYSVTNFDTDEELIQLFFPVSASAGILGLTAPEGFGITYNEVQNLINLRWDDDDLTMQTFAPGSTVSGFQFTSVDGPGMVEFTAQDILQDYTGSTTAPVPEPSALLLGLASLPVLLRRRRP